MAKKYIVEYIHPPIPIRQFDYCAYFDGEEEGICEFGKTEDEAIENLKKLAEQLNE